MTFGKKSTAEGVTDGIDLSGKTAVITGVNSGLGKESMRVLAMRGAHVIGLARTEKKAAQACHEVKGETTPLACELSNLDSVADCADAIRDLKLPVDILMTNAGIMAPQELSLANGVEMQFATNHLGHFVLVNRLLDQVRAAEQGRIVILSSAAHTLTVRGGIDFDNLDAQRGYDAWRFYGQSKLANILMARVLSEMLEDSTATANSLHPGVIRTNLGRDIGGLFSRFMMLMAPFIEKTVPQGAATQCYVATHPDLSDISGVYFSDCAPARTTLKGRDDKLARQLWEVSVELVGDYLH